MDSLTEFTYGPTELVGWGLQILLIALVSRRAAGPIRLPEPGISFCLLVLSLGWVFRLAYLFALASDGFMYWIGDDPIRWLTSWSWLRSHPGELKTVAIWMPGTFVLHGTVMALIPNPLYASKLLSASYSVMSLAGVFVFAQGLFRNRVASLACVVFLAPFWIDILLSTGTMAEMPTVGAMLGGAGALLYGLRLPVGRRRTLVLLCAAGGFAIATLFHMVAWILLTGILLFLLPVFLRSEHGSPWTRLRSWVLFCAASTPWCFAWAIEQWISTGSPFTALREAGELTKHKIGGPVDYVALLGRVASIGELVTVAVAGVALLVLIGLYFVTPRDDRRGGGWLGAAKLRRARWGAAIVSAMCWLVAFAVIQDWMSALSPGERERVVSNWTVFPVSLVYCLHYYLPLVLSGIFVVLRKQDGQRSEPRLVLACIGWVLVVLMATSLTGGANVSPFRTVLALSTALLPFAIAPLFGRYKGIQRSAWPAIGVALLALGANAAANHTRIDTEIPVPSMLRSDPPPQVIFGFVYDVKRKRADIAALGSWIRAETMAPGYLSSENLSHPFELILFFDNIGLNRAMIEYRAGDPARFTNPHRLQKRVLQTHERSIAELVPDQVLIADYDVDVPELRLITRVGQYRIYERQGP